MLPQTKTDNNHLLQVVGICNKSLTVKSEHQIAVVADAKFIEDGRTHKINNAIGQVLLARRMGKKRIIAETGAG